MYKITDTKKTKFKLLDTKHLENGVSVPTICGQVGQCEVVSQNGYYYKRDFWPTILSDSVVQNQIAAKEMRGTIEHPSDDSKFLCTPYEDTSHIVLKAWEENGNPFAVFALLNNPKGNSIKALIDVGATVGVSTRGMGQFGRDNKGQFVDPQDYLLITYDVVASPNFGDLRMSAVTDSLIQNPLFKELCDAHQIKDSAYKGYNKEGLIYDMGKMISELQEKFEILSKL